MRRHDRYLSDSGSRSARLPPTDRVDKTEGSARDHTWPRTSMYSSRERDFCSVEAASVPAWPTMMSYPRHGGDLAFARSHYPSATDSWLDLSTGINPVGYPGLPITVEMLARLPD